MAARTVTKFVCYDCNEATGSVMLVRRGVDDSLTVYVHRTGSGCHKGVDGHTIRFGECHSEVQA